MFHIFIYICKEETFPDYSDDKAAKCEVCTAEISHRIHDDAECHQPVVVADWHRYLEGNYSQGMFFTPYVENLNRAELIPQKWVSRFKNHGSPIHKSIIFYQES